MSSPDSLPADLVMDLPNPVAPFKLRSLSLTECKSFIRIITSTVRLVEHSMVRCDRPFEFLNIDFCSYREMEKQSAQSSEHSDKIWNQWVDNQD